MNFSTDINLGELADINGLSGFVIKGIDSGVRSNQASNVPLITDRVVSGAGDINGDDIDDFIIGAPGARPDNRVNAGESYVVFGTTSGFPNSLNVQNLNGSNGFTLFSSNRNSIFGGDLSGSSVSSAGDINNDGLSDLIIGAPTADPTNAASAGKGYVLFGSSTGFAPRIELSSLNDGSTGFTINGINANDMTGTSVNEAGDVNGDGIDDILIGGSRESYVVFGRAGGFAGSVELAGLDGSDGFAIAATSKSISGVGDINGDGIDDIAVGSFNPDEREQVNVIFGQQTAFAARLEDADVNGSNSLKLTDVSPGLDDVFSYDESKLELSISGAGDVNGDGVDDIIIGAALSEPVLVGNGSFTAPTVLFGGRGYVVFGDADGLLETLSLSTLDGTNGFAIAGDNDSLGASVSGLGDINDDGLDDVAIGAPDRGLGGRSGQQSHIVFGQASGFASTLQVNDLDGSQGITLSGVPQEFGQTGIVSSGDRIGVSISGAGDVNGDGVDDVIVASAPAGRSGSSPGSDRSYVLFGRSSDTIDVQGRPASIFVNDAGEIAGNAFFAGDSYEGSLLSSTDGTGNANDAIAGTSGSDNIWAGNEGNDVIDSGAGDDTIGIGDGDTSVIAAAGNDFVYAIGDGGGDNTISLGEGNNNFWAKAGNNTITAGSGNNLIAAGSGRTTVTTGDGEDFVYSLSGGAAKADGSDAIRLDLGGGNDTVWLDNDNFYLINTGEGDDIIGVGTGGGDISARDGNDIIYMLNPDDANHSGKNLSGGNGNDYIQGGAGDDTISGGDGDDLLEGGKGANRLFGGFDDGDSDTFVVTSAGTHFISGFEVGIDSILLSDTSFGELDFFESANEFGESSTFVTVNGNAFIEVFDVSIADLNSAANFV